MSASVVDGRIWVIGASDEEDGRFVTPLVHDPASNAWTVGEPTQTAPNAVGPGHAAMVMPRGQLLLLGSAGVPVQIGTSLP